MTRSLYCERSAAVEVGKTKSAPTLESKSARCNWWTSGAVVRRGVTHGPTLPRLRRKGHKVEGVGGVDAVKDGHIVLDLQIDEVRPDLLEFMRGLRDLRIGAIGFEIMRENTLSSRSPGRSEWRPSASTRPCWRRLKGACRHRAEAGRHKAGTGRKKTSPVVCALVSVTR